MGVLLSVSTVLFAILCVILIILILLQSDKSAGMGILGGSSQSAFGSSTADVITKISAVMIGLFMVGSLGLAVLESIRTPTLNIDDLRTTPALEAENVKADGKPGAGEKSGKSGQETPSGDK
jgi:preprotein translocase subunit SecG